MISISEAAVVDDELVDAFARLIPQLSRSNPPPDAEALTRIVTSEASTLLLARDEDGRIVGSMTLAMFEIPTGVRAWIEDVVVDESARGQGVAGRRQPGRGQPDGPAPSRPTSGQSPRRRRISSEMAGTTLWRSAITA